MIKSFPHFAARWLAPLALAVSILVTAAQDNDPSPAEPPRPESPVAAAEPPQPADPANPASDAEQRAQQIENGVAEALNEVTNIVRELFADGPRLQFSANGAGPAVGVLNDVDVATDDTVEAVVAVLANYQFRGRCRGDAVVVFGRGEIAGPVEGESITVFGELNVTAPVAGDLRVVGSKAYINSHIKGDVVAVMSEVEFGPLAIVDGERQYVGPQPTAHPDAVFNGPIIPIHVPGLPVWLVDYVRYGVVLGRPMVPSLRWCWYLLGFLFVFRLVLLLLFPKPVELGAGMLRERALRSFAIGVIAMVLIPIVQVVLAATGVGLIAVPFLGVAVLIAAMLGKIAVLRAIGGQLGRQLNLPALDTPVGGFAAGTVLVALIYMVPYLGGIVFLLIKPMALGAMLIVAVEGFRRERPAPANLPPPTTLPPTRSPIIAAPQAAAPAVAAPMVGISTDPGPRVSANATAPATNSTASDVPPVLGTKPPRPGDISSEELIALPRVGFWPRLGASFLDFVLVLFVAAVLGLMNQGSPVFFVPLFLAYHVALWTWRGTTLGGIVFRLRLVRVDGRPLDLTVTVVRALAACLSFFVACLGFFWASWNPDRQSWHDMIAGTAIVKTPRSLPLV